MEASLTPIQKLDIVLAAISNEPAFRTALHTMVLVLEKGIELNELKLILDKLEVDRFATHDYVEGQKSITGTKMPTYKITFEGLYFSKSGGYYQKSLNDTSENIRLKSLEVSRQSQGRALNWLTFWIALGTIIAAIYYLTELYWKYHWFH